MPRIDYSYDGVPTVRRFSNSTKFIRGLMGPFGSGKSSGCVIETVKLAALQPKGADGIRRARIACIRNTYRQLDDTTAKTVKDWLPPEYCGTYLVGDHRYLVKRGDMEIEYLFRALDRPEHVANLLSAEFTAAWVNEAREVPWAVIQALQGRVGRYPGVKDGGCVRAGIIMDTNPPDTDSWWYRLFEEKKPENAELFRQPPGRAPNAENLDKLPANYYQNLVATMDSDQVRCYVDGDYGYIRDGKPVYPEFNDALHCVDIEPNKGSRVIRGWDFGLSPACIWTQVLPDGRWLIFDELVADNIDIYSFADAVEQHQSINHPWIKKPLDIGDPAGQARSANVRPTDEKSCFDILRGKGIAIEPGEQTVVLRIGSVRHALQNMVAGKPRAALHSRCKMLRKGFQGRYQYRRIQVSGSSERYQDVPDKNEYSHPHDALQYVGARLFANALRKREPTKPMVNAPYRPLDPEMNY